VLEIVYNTTDLQSIKAPIQELIVSAVGGTLAAEDPNVMASTQTAAELVSILLNASGGCGRKAIRDLKDSHLIGKTRLSRDWPTIGAYSRKHLG